MNTTMNTWEEYSVQDTPEEREQALLHLVDTLPALKIEEETPKPKNYEFNGVIYD